MGNHNNSTVLQQVEFITNCLRNGLERKEILQRFTETYKNKSIKTFDNRLKVAREQMRGEIKDIEARTELSITNEVEARKLRIMTVAERIDILTKIAFGEIPLTKPMVCDGVIQLVPVVPDWTDRRGAIAELNKMDGSYAPIKQANTNVAGDDLPTTFVFNHNGVDPVKE